MKHLEIGERRTLLVTGTRRGIGRELSRALVGRGDRVVVTARSLIDAAQLANELSPDGSAAIGVALDVTDASSIAAALESVKSAGWSLDILVNNAGIDFDYDQQAATADLARVRRIIETNLLGAWAVTEAFLPVLPAGSAIIMVTSEDASMQRMAEGSPGYRVSKAALNALTRVLAAELRERQIDVRAASPGWTETDMGGEGGQPVPDGVRSLLVAIDAPVGSTDTYTPDGEPLPWGLVRELVLGRIRAASSGRSVLPPQEGGPPVLPQAADQERDAHQLQSKRGRDNRHRVPDQEQDEQVHGEVRGEGAPGHAELVIDSG
jgi:NAD(P)-dependent dehydrogenase (short-subunit alcohol dehydrogenase family)